MSAILETARSYRDDRGWKVIPLVEKRPTCDNYVEARYKERDFTKPGRNIGVVLGSWSGWLVDIDLDSPEAVELADLYLPVTHSMFGRASKPRSHRLYRATGATHEVFSDPLVETKKVLLELLSDTAGGAPRHTMFPGSLHPSGEIVRWDEDGESRVIDADRLRLACAWLATGCVVLRHLSDYLEARSPSMDLPKRVWSAWPAVARPIHKWLGIDNPDDRLAPRRKVPDDVNLRDLVAMIPNDFDREGWVKVGMAIFEAGGDYATFLEFSRRSTSHHNPKTVEGRWRSFERHPPRHMNGLAKLKWLAKGNR